MVKPVELVQYNHVNQTVESLDAAIKYTSEVLGAQLLFEAPPNPFTRAALINFGGAIVELVEKNRPMPTEPADGNYFFWHCMGTAGFIMEWDKLGPCFVGCEFLVRDLDQSAADMREQGLRVFYQPEYSFFMTYADQSHGLAFEITNVDWYKRPSPPFFTEQIREKDYWRDEHPLGITGYRFSVAVRDLAGVAEFYERLSGATVVYTEERPMLDCRVTALQLADVVVDFMAPTGDGPIRSFVDRYGERIRALILEVKDMDAVRRYFEEKQVPLIAGDRPGSVAIVPDQNLGVLYQFELAR